MKHYNKDKAQWYSDYSSKHVFIASLLRWEKLQTVVHDKKVH